MNQEYFNTIKALPFLPRNVIPFVTRNLPGANANLTEAIKLLIEVMPKSITELRTGAALNPDGTAVVPHNSDPVLSWVAGAIPEKYGRSIQALLNAWLTVQIRTMDPMAMGIDVLFIEPDPTYTMVVQAWHCKNMVFREFEGVKGLRDLTLDLTNGFVNVTFKTRETEQGEETMSLAKDIMARLVAVSENPLTPLTFKKEEQNEQENKEH